MHAWPAPDVPRLPGPGVPLRLHDTATGQVRPVAPGPTAGMYVCGITPYDSTHLGHAATYLAFDLVNRVLRDNGHDVRYVQNVTDVDDPLLARAVRDGQDWRELAERETERFRADMTALDVIPPDAYEGVVEAMPIIVDVVHRLESSGAAYRIDDDIYFDITAARRFGEVSGLPRDAMLELFAERGGDPERPGKRHPLDALLWRGARPDEPSWDTDLGPGRPGWHVECVAIAIDGLGLPFDIQGGGRDLAFPHHEMSAAHGEAVTGSWPFARHYVHAGMIGLDGEKMSKSRGNLVFVETLRDDGANPSAIRLALYAGHYREDRQWQTSLLDQAQSRLALWQEAVARGAGLPAEDVLSGVRRALADDLDTPRALAHIDRWAADTLAGLGSSRASGLVVRDLCRSLLGVSVH